MAHDSLSVCQQCLTETTTLNIKKTHGEVEHGQKRVTRQFWSQRTVFKTVKKGTGFGLWMISVNLPAQ